MALYLEIAREKGFMRHHNLSGEALECRRVAYIYAECITVVSMYVASRYSMVCS